jgi:hypothetical protein
MKLLKIALITLILLTLSASASALSIPSMFGLLTSFPALSTNTNPIGAFSFGTSDGNSIIASNPLTDMSSISSTPQGSSSVFPVITPSTSTFFSSGINGLNSPIDSQLSDYSTQGIPNNYANPGECESTDQSIRMNVDQAQKDEALKIAASSPLCKQYNVYPDESWGCEWAAGSFPMISSNSDLEVYTTGGTLTDNTLVITVDLDSGTIVSSQIEPNVL